MAVVIHVTRSNIEWAVSRTDKTREAIERELARCEEEGVVCVLEVPYKPEGYVYEEFPLGRGSW